MLHHNYLPMFCKSGVLMECYQSILCKLIVGEYNDKCKLLLYQFRI